MVISTTPSVLQSFSVITYSLYCVSILVCRNPIQKNRVSFFLIIKQISYNEKHQQHRCYNYVRRVCQFCGNFTPPNGTGKPTKN